MKKKTRANYGEKPIDCSKTNNIDSRNDDVHSQILNEQSSSEVSDNEKKKNGIEIKVDRHPGHGSVRPQDIYI